MVWHEGKGNKSNYYRWNGSIDYVLIHLPQAQYRYNLIGLIRNIGRNCAHIKMPKDVAKVMTDDKTN